MKLYCATSNPGKLREFRMAYAEAEIILASLAPLEIKLLPSFREIPPCAEDGATFEENAVKKALHYGDFAPGLLFADDSGLEVDALGGAPGIHSARFAGTHATDADNNQLLLDRMRRVARRTARFICVIALVQCPPDKIGTGLFEPGDSRPAQRLHGGPNQAVTEPVEGRRLLSVYRGSVEGTILDSPRGAGGFGYDPLFYYPPIGRTFAELSAEEKIGVSHRGQAMRAMLEALPALLGSRAERING